MEFDYEKEGMLQDMFRRQAAATPDAVAVVGCEGERFTYGELDVLTDNLSSYLRLKGVVPDSCVGIYMGRCMDYVVAYIAILKAGGAYLPLDIAYPQSLLGDILMESEPVVILSKTDLMKNLTGFSGAVFCMDPAWPDLVQAEMEDVSLPPMPAMTQDDLAYIVYSSGTTGKPKGIACPHRGAVLSYHWRHITYPYEENEREAAHVFFVWEMFRPLCKGATLYVIPDSVIYDPKLLCQFVQSNGITRQLYTPSLFEALLESDIDRVKESFKSMKTIVFCGEVVTTRLLTRSVTALPWIRFVNLYSISESHDVTEMDLSEYFNTHMESDIKSRQFCPVGKLLPLVKVVILDDNLTPQHVGVSGEIYVAGPTLARGYLKRPDLNATRFIPRPSGVSPDCGDRLYRTGDWGYLLSGGTFEICGRCDSMVKIRGYSIEIQAVEAALMGLSVVASCVVLVKGEEGEDKFLVSYIVTDGLTNKKEVRALLKQKLPFYMIPSYFVFLKKIPILPTSGKLDKKALPPHDAADPAENGNARALTSTEASLLPMWMEVLNCKSIDVQESFFDLGGHSLLAAKLVEMMNEKFGTDVRVQDLYERSTIEEIGTYLDAGRDRTSSNGEAGGGTTTAKSSGINLAAEVNKYSQSLVVNMDTKLRAFWRSCNFQRNWRSSSVLLTGATGFLGAFLLKSMILKTKMHIHCLVRGKMDKTGKERVEQTLKNYGIIGSSTEEAKKVEEALKFRVTVATGDVSLMRLGLSGEDYQYLSSEIDHVVHAAAHVNLTYPYHALQSTNVVGTENVLLFCLKNKVKPLHYISTDAVIPENSQHVGEGDSAATYWTSLTSGYGQSKWVAEQLVLYSQMRGLPSVIYRPGNLSGDSKTSFWNPQDTNLYLIRSFVESGVVPEGEWTLEMTPVNFVSDLVARLTQNGELAYGKTLHLLQPIRLPAAYVFNSLAALGYAVKRGSFQDWKERVSQVTGSDSRQASLLNTSFSVEESLYDCVTCTYTNLTSVLDTLSLTYPTVDIKLFRSYLLGLKSHKIIPQPAMSWGSTHQPLLGKVVVVTGASSGIGAGTALHFSRAGAKVALGARREEKLQEVKETIEKEGGEACYLKTDVTDRQQVRDLVSLAEQKLGPVDILVNNAGVMHYTYMAKLEESKWEQMVDLNCKGMLNGVAAVLDGMKERKSGHIINLSSDAGRKSFPGLAVYCGTKYFVEGFSGALRQEVKGYNIKVTTLQPGDVKTELLSHCTDKECLKEFSYTPGDAILEIEDIGRAMVYISSQPQHCAINEMLIEPTIYPL